MKKHYDPFQAALRFLTALFALAAALPPLNAQTCIIASNPVVTQFTPNTVTDAGQSVVLAGCASGNFTSFTVYSNTAHTNVRLRIYENSYFGAVRYTDNSVVLNSDLVLGTQINLSPANGSVSFTGGESYVFRLDFQEAGPFFSLHKSISSVYDDGVLFENGIPTSEDLRFIVMTDALLPVELTFFDARAQGRRVSLDWRTASEQGCAGFGVERSAEGENWQELHFAQGGGTTGEARDYRFLDEKPLTGNSYYRLRQVDFNGSFEFSPTRAVRLAGSGSDELAVFPNPAESGQALRVSGMSGEVKGVALADVFGKIIVEETLPEEGSAEIALPANLAKGVYVLVLRSEQERVARKVSVR